MTQDLPTGTVTFVFTDVEGSTKLLHERGAEAYAAALSEHRHAVREAFGRHGGVEVDTQGDAFFYAFADASAAVEATLAANAALAAGPIRVRMGLHTGAPHLTEEGYVGEDVHLGARIAAAGHGGQVLLSAATRAFLAGELRDLGEHRLKDFTEPVAIFQLGDERFPPLQTISNTNLPRPASSFVGRERETAEIAELTRRNRLVTLSGPGGSGKTRLSIEAAAELVGEFKAGVFWVGLAALRDPNLVLEAVGQTLGAKDGLATHVGERELLLVLDNLEQVVGAAPELASLVETCPNLHLLVTSRELLRIRGEVEYPVPPLAEPEAVNLFSERAGLEADETIAELCRRLDNLPRAGELAAARTSVLAPAEILARLAQRLDLLKGGRDAETRQRTLRATIEWSHDLLAEDERRLFARLAVFAGGCTLAPAESVTAADLDTLQSLVDKSLVRHSDGRFWMLETIREYAAAQLSAAEEADAIRRRYADHFLALAEEAAEHTSEWASNREWFDRLEREHDNLRAALAWLEEAGETQPVLRLAGALRNFWGSKGFVTEGFRRLEQALAADDAPTEARARAANAAADLGGLGAGNPDAAAYWAGQGLELHRRLGDPSGEAESLFILAHAACDRQDFARARELAEESRSLFEETGDSTGAAGATWMLGWAQTGLGEAARGRESYEDALARARAADLPLLQSLVLYSLSGRILDAGEAVRALELAGEAWKLAHEQGERWRMALTACRLATILGALGRSADAALAQVAGLTALEEMGGVPLHAVDEHQRTLERLEDELGEEGLEAQRRRARKMSLEEAVETALGAA